jgi:hypothetical protein
MMRLLLRLALYFYPRWWHVERGDEYRALLDDLPCTARQVYGVIRQAVDAWLHADKMRTCSAVIQHRGATVQRSWECMPSVPGDTILFGVMGVVSVGSCILGGVGQVTAWICTLLMGQGPAGSTIADGLILAMLAGGVVVGARRQQRTRMVWAIMRVGVPLICMSTSILVRFSTQRPRAVASAFIKRTILRRDSLCTMAWVDQVIQCANSWSWYFAASYTEEEWPPPLNQFPVLVRFPGRRPRAERQAAYASSGE